jgi:hypothetical protein
MIVGVSPAIRKLSFAYGNLVMPKIRGWAPVPNFNGKYNITSPFAPSAYLRNILENECISSAECNRRGILLRVFWE